MAETVKKKEKRFLLRTKEKLFEAVRKASEKNNRSMNGEIEQTLTEKYL